MADEFDYVIVGGGTRRRRRRGAPLARIRTSPSACSSGARPTSATTTCCRSAAGSACSRARLDLAYTTTLQPRGNAHIVHSRAQVLGGCSSHNTMIWFKPFPDDWKDWVDQGCTGWSNDEMDPYYDRIPGPHGLVGEADRNAILYDWIEACGSALGVTKNPDWNAAPVPRRRRVPRRRLRPGDRRALVVVA